MSVSQTTEGLVSYVILARNARAFRQIIYTTIVAHIYMTMHTPGNNRTVNRSLNSCVLHPALHVKHSQ